MMKILHFYHKISTEFASLVTRTSTGIINHSPPLVLILGKDVVTLCSICDCCPLFSFLRVLCCFE